ncbi:MAG TPA: hypothetical protein VFT47_18980 [Vicinamibacterales bacterium]|nr:hypothetical protein [Vicinamibacterales bacterium]
MKNAGSLLVCWYGSAEARFDLPLGRLQPGAFVLRVEATRDTSTARREVPFTVR